MASAAAEKKQEEEAGTRAPPLRPLTMVRIRLDLAVASSLPLLVRAAQGRGLERVREWRLSGRYRRPWPPAGCEGIGSVWRRRRCGRGFVSELNRIGVRLG